MDKNVRNKIIEKCVSIIILIGIMMILVGLIVGEILGYREFKDLIPLGILVIVAPIFFGLVYMLSCMAFGINND